MNFEQWWTQLAADNFELRELSDWQREWAKAIARLAWDAGQKARK